MGHPRQLHVVGKIYDFRLAMSRKLYMTWKLIGSHCGLFNGDVTLLTTLSELWTFKSAKNAAWPKLICVACEVNYNDRKSCVSYTNSTVSYSTAGTVQCSGSCKALFHKHAVVSETAHDIES